MKSKLHPLLVVLGLLFGSAVLTVSIAKGVELGVLAQGEGVVLGQMEETELAETTDIADEISEQAANYYLPYPGILPDHPLYFLKMIRDKLMEWFTFDKQEKIKLLELYADKRLGAARALIEGGQAELGTETARKAVRYQERAIKLAEELKEEGEDVGRVANQVEKATAKHEQVLSTIEEKAAEQGQENIGEIRDKVRENRRVILKVLGR